MKNNKFTKADGLVKVEGLVKTDYLVKPEYIVLILIVTLMGFIVYWFTGLEML